MAKLNTINHVAKIFCEAVKEVLETSTASKITFSPTIQNIPSISLKPDIGCFVQFAGDYSGLFIMNLSGPAALEIYRRSMTYMGLPQGELATEYSSDDVVSCIGEMINQVIGKARSKVEKEYGLTADNNQPKAITISTAITLSIATMLDKPRCRRLSFKTEDNHPFYVEMNMEQTEFIKLFDVEKSTGDAQADIDAMIAEGIETDGSSESSEDVDVDAIMAEFSK
jgi:CheY-specific phosphatase CheX